MLEKEKSISILYPNLIEEWHPVKNKRIYPDFIPFGTYKKLWWKCSKGHEWESTIDSRNRGNCFVNRWKSY
ncbi:hypothetical protein FC678_25665 [Peribacillus simplex]|uniref:Treble clef zinc finger domain-containing protein n=1 Tax=Peribacillus simplex TaxID=1478 RepID=A0A9X8ZC97_9BACI|nr:hypothetical protein FC678_25665 [Peribacillus simplex]